MQRWIGDDGRWRSLRRRLAHWLQRRHTAQDLDDEMEAHRALHQAALERNGMAAPDAARASRRALGNVTLAKEDARDVWAVRLLEQVARDARYAVRTLARERTFSLTAAVTLALAIAAAATVFAVVDAALWRPLPFPHPDRLVAIYTSGATTRLQYEPASPRDLLAWKSARGLYGVAATMDPRRRVVLTPAAPESLVVRGVTTDFFDVLGIRPALGRAFTSTSAAAGEAILTHEAWVRLFAANPQVLGRRLDVDDESVTVVGVMDADFRAELFDLPELFVAFDPAIAAEPGRRSLMAIGRLADGVSVTVATQELEAIATALGREFPETNAARRVRMEDLRSSSSGADWRPLTFFLTAAGFVLLLACTNVAGLLLARAHRRQRELAIRRALGGGPAAIARQLLVEGAVLAAAGVALGVLLATWVTAALPAVLPAAYLGRDTIARIDARALVGAIAVTAVASLLFGLAPAAIARRGGGLLLGQGDRTIGTNRSQGRARNALVVIEITLALVLLAGAGLFLNSFVRLIRMPIGFEPRDVLTFRVSTAGPRYAGPGATDLFARQILDRVSALPGVRFAALTTSAPLGSGPIAYFRPADRPRPAEGTEPRAIVRAVSPAYFSTLRIPIVAGRVFDEGDDTGATHVAIVNEHLARLYGGRAALGQVLELLPGRSPWVPAGRVTIVGIVSAVKEIGFNEVDFNGIYLPAAQVSREPIQVVVNTSTPAGTIAAAVRREVQGLDPVVPVLGMRTMDDVVSGALQADRFNLLLSAVFALLATVIAALGLYGVMAYVVEQRTREFGVRLALGSSVRGLLGLALRQGLTLAAVGITLGLAVVLAIGRVLGNALYLVAGQHNGLLFGVSVADPLTLCGTAALLFGVAFAAALGPAVRATRVDPVVALRAD